MIEAVLPPFLLRLIENKKLHQVSVKKRQPILSKIKSLTIKICLKESKHFKSAMLKNGRRYWVAGVCKAAGIFICWGGFVFQLQ